MDWHIVKADKKRKKWTIRGELWDGRVVKIPGHRDRKVAEQMMRNIESLNRSKRFGELPETHLKEWIDGLIEEEAKRYVSLGLLERRFLDKRRPIDDLLKEFVTHLKANSKSRRSLVPKRKPQMVRRIFNAIGDNTTFDMLTQDNVNAAIKGLISLEGRWKGQLISQKTHREYVFAIKSFCEWMVDTRRASWSPLRKIKPPSAKGSPIRNRRPLSVGEFSKLMAYLCNGPAKYKGQNFAWTNRDRLMIYWMAVMTGFRANELRSLTRAHLDLDSVPARVTVEGWVAKNGQKATIPIAEDITRALKDYCAHLHPKARLLRMPADPSYLTKGFYRDLDAAEVRRNFDDGSVVDFHTLRSTAICWWLTENKLHLLDVQYRARLKTLALVQEYVDNYVPNHAELVKNTPRVIDPNLPFRRAV